MNNSPEVPSTQEYLNSLEGAKIKFSNTYKKKKSNFFLKDFIAIIIVLGILCVFFFDGNVFNLNIGDATKPKTVVEGTGDYVCSTEASDAADRLKPSSAPSDAASLKLDNELTRLNSEKIYIETETVRIKSSPGLSTTKSAGEALKLRIEQYTKDVIAFNEKSLAYQQEMEAYNTKVKTYNKYLLDHCEKIKSGSQ